MVAGPKELNYQSYYDRALLCDTFDRVKFGHGTAFALIGIQNYTKCLQCNSENAAEILIRRAILYSRVGKIDEGRDDVQAVKAQVLKTPALMKFANAQLLTLVFTDLVFSPRVFEPWLGKDGLQGRYTWDWEDVMRNLEVVKKHIGSDVEGVLELTAFLFAACCNNKDGVALETIDRILEIEPQNLSCHVIAAQIFHMRLSSDDEEQHLLKVREIVGDCAEYRLLHTHLRMFSAYSDRSNEDEMVEDLNYVMNERGVFGDLIYARALYWCRQGKYLEATKEFQYVISNWASFPSGTLPDELEIVKDAVESAFLGKLYGEVIRLLKDAEKNPEFKNGQHSAIFMLFRSFSKEKLNDPTAKDDLREAKRLDPTWRSKRILDSFLKEWTISPDDAGRSTDDADVTQVLSDNVFILEGNTWKVRFNGGRVVHLNDLLGMKHIHRLLSRQGSEIDVKTMPREKVAVEESTLHLVDGGKVRHAMTPVPALDKKAKEVYRKRLGELSELRKTAELNSDKKEISKINKETKFLRGQLTGSFVIKDAELGNTSAAVRNAIDRAIENIYKHLPELGNHFEQYIKTGSTLSYNPPENTDWLLS